MRINRCIILLNNTYLKKQKGLFMCEIFGFNARKQLMKFQLYNSQHGRTIEVNLVKIYEEVTEF